MLQNFFIFCACITVQLVSRRSYVWEILNLTIRKMSQHVHKLTVEAAEARARLHHDSGDDSDSEDDRRDRPSDEQVERMEERLEQAQSDQKTLFLIIFQVSCWPGATARQAKSESGMFSGGRCWLGGQ